MIRSIINFALIVALLLSAGLTYALDQSADSAEDMKIIKNSGKLPKTPDARKTKQAATIKLVDINSASMAELKKLAGIKDAEADKIIAGRPYLTKAHLVTRNIISAEAYENLKKQIIAKQGENPTAKAGRKPQ